MNKSNLKSYAPQARKDFIAAVTARAALLGITADRVVPATVSGGVAIIDGVEWPAKVATQRDALLARIARHGADGFARTMEEVAYTWFNRFAALRYMELHELLDHGHRVLSSRDGGLPELLRHAAEVSLPGLQAARVQELQLAGNQDNQLYKLLLVAQCNELSRTMPFLFERIDDDTELLLPDHLLRTDSIIAKLVAGVPEEDWQEIEVIGWLYQFYISEKKADVIGKVVKSEDIPAATQLFTPNWIVQYLVQNSVGRLWLMANPGSQLASQWPYYIQPAEQTPEVQSQLDALIHTRIAEDGDTLNPETITCLDPACGSGHILVVAYDVLKAIYLERGYRLRDIPRLILEKNLYGLDIDDRAAQLAGFALLMKARADDRRLLADPDNPPRLNILSLQESQGLDAQALHAALTAGHSPQASTRAPDAEFADTDLFPATRPQMTLGEAAALPAPGASTGLTQSAIAELLATFEHAKTFGSLIQIGPQRLPSLREQLSFLNNAEASGDLYAQAAAKDLLPLVRQALVLGMQFDAVVANPPYLDRFTSNFRIFAKNIYPQAWSNTYSMFIERAKKTCKKSGFFSLVTLQGWMFNSTFEDFRLSFSKSSSMTSMLHLGTRGFDSLSGEVVSTTAFCCINHKFAELPATFYNLTTGKSEAEKRDNFLKINVEFSREKLIYERKMQDFEIIPGSPVAYWASTSIVNAFSSFPFLEKSVDPRSGMATGDNERFLRCWFEVDIEKVKFNATNREEAQKSNKKWFPYNKGGTFRRWYGNNELLVLFEDDGFLIKKTKKDNLEKGLITANNSKCWNQERYFQPCLTWSALSNKLSMRLCAGGFIFDTKGQSLFASSIDDLKFYNALLNSCVSSELLQILTPTLDFNSGYLRKIPDPAGFMSNKKEVVEIEANCRSIASSDWDSRETSWGFRELDLISKGRLKINLLSSYESCRIDWNSKTKELKELEERNNIIFAKAYGLYPDIETDVPIQDVTLNCNSYFRYGVGLSAKEADSRLAFDAAGDILSYAIGCMMGRYSLDAPGLIYAHAGNVGFDASRYPSFPADADGILPVTDQPWFADDAPTRIREFLHAVWGPDTLEENLAWLAESLGQKSTGGASETPEETIRRYIANQFFKDHLQTYKKRPIYWLFSSGKQGAFQALVYLHRYHEGTLARMRSEYVIPLTAKYAARLDLLAQDATAATSAAARTKINKQIETLRKQQAELLAFDEKLRHYADMRITLDLDDGVKVNYGKFGDLLAGVKVVTGGTGDE